MPPKRKSLSLTDLTLPAYSGEDLYWSPQESPSRKRASFDKNSRGSRGSRDRVEFSRGSGASSRGSREIEFSLGSPTSQFGSPTNRSSADGAPWQLRDVGAALPARRSAPSSPASSEEIAPVPSRLTQSGHSRSDLGDRSRVRKGKSRTTSAILLPGSRVSVDDTDNEDWTIGPSTHIISRSPTLQHRKLGPASSTPDRWDPAGLDRPKPWDARS